MEFSMMEDSSSSNSNQNLLSINDDDDKLLKVAVSSQKERHRVEIRRRNIQNVLMSKRLHSYESGRTVATLTFQQQQLPSSEDNTMSILTYISTINEACDANFLPNKDISLDRVTRALSFIRAHIIQTLQSKDDNIINASLNDFTQFGGCACIMQFLDEKYLPHPSLQLLAAVILGNIFVTTEKPITAQLLQCGIAQLAVDLLRKATAAAVTAAITAGNQKKQITGVQLELLCQIVRTLANMAGESYQIRMEIILRGGISGYLASDVFPQLLHIAPGTLAAEFLFFVKNMIAETPMIFDDHQEKFIVPLKILFLQPNLPIEGVQEGLFAIRGFAKYGNTVLRAKMIAHRDVFERVHDLCDPRKNSDPTNVFFALTTLKDFMRYSNRQTQYLFNIQENNLLDTISYVLETPTVQFDVQVAAIEVLFMYVSCDDADYFMHVYAFAFNLIKQVLHIAIFNSNNRINYRAKETIFVCILRADRFQQLQLVANDAVQVIYDALVEDDNAQLKVDAINAVSALLDTQNAGQIDTDNNPVQNVLESKFPFKDILENLARVDNLDDNLAKTAAYLLDTYFS